MSPRRVQRFVDALLPRGWPDRGAIVACAQQVDQDLGCAPLDATLSSWAAWRQFGDEPACRALRTLLQALHDVVSGGLGPRPMPSAQSVA